MALFEICPAKHNQQSVGVENCDFRWLTISENDEKS